MNYLSGQYGMSYHRVSHSQSVYTSTKLSTSDYYPFGSLMPGRTVMDTARKCVDMTRLERVWQPAVIDMDPLTPYFMNISGWGAANYEFRDGNTQLLIEIEDSKSGLEIALDPSITEGEIVLKTKVFEISDNGILLRVQGVDSNGDARMFYQSHEQIIEESLVIPLKAGYTHYSILIQGAVSMVFDGGTIYNGHWVETEVLVRVCDDGGDQYRFGFNGQEKVNEVSGMGNHLDFGARYYDSRVGTFLSLDPLSFNFPFISNYTYAGNSPIAFIDKDGEKREIYTIIMIEKTGETIIHKQTTNELFKQRFSYNEKVFGISTQTWAYKYDWFDFNTINVINVDELGNHKLVSSKNYLGELRTTTWFDSENKARVNNWINEKFQPTKGKDHDGYMFTTKKWVGEGNYRNKKYQAGGEGPMINLDDLLSFFSLASRSGKVSKEASLDEVLSFVNGALQEIYNISNPKVEKIFSEKKICPRCKKLEDKPHIDKVNGKGIYEIIDKN